MFKNQRKIKTKPAAKDTATCLEIDVLLILISLKKESMMGAIRIKRDIVFKSQDLAGHIQILQELRKLVKIIDTW